MLRIRRKLIDELKNHLRAKEISLIIGPRQAGKTTLMNELKNYLDQRGEKTVFFNLDFETDKTFFLSQEGLIKKLDLELGRKKGFVFIDEIQRKENAGLFLKGIYDMELPYKLIISGSGSLELKEKIHESLAGRKRIFELGTVSFREFADFKTGYKYAGKLDDFFEIEKERSLSLLEEYLNFGGYPRVVLESEISEKVKVINEIYRSYIEKDIAYFMGVNRIDAFGTLIKLLASQSGQIVKYSNLAQESNISVSTLKNYLWYAEKTFLIKTIKPYFRNKHKEIIKAPMAYFYDLGMRNFSLGLFGNLNQPDQLGFVFQNYAANALWEKIENTSKNLHFWRTLDGAEVDFVISDSSSVLPIEVKHSLLRKTAITRSLHNFIREYSPKEAWVVNLGAKRKIKIGKTAVKFIPYYSL